MKTESLANLSMDGKIAVVTGSTQGLGEAIAHLFVDRGVKGIVITGRNTERGAAQVVRRSRVARIKRG